MKAFDWFRSQKTKLDPEIAEVKARATARAADAHAASEENIRLIEERMATLKSATKQESRTMQHQNAVEGRLFRRSK